MRAILVRVVCALALAGLAACAHAPASLPAVAGGHGFDHYTLTTPAGFRHAIAVADGTALGPVHIYIEGDGAPWIGEYLPAADPTPATLVALEMMQEGGRPGLYVGRPCYFGFSADRRCDPLLWTHARFGPLVQRSMGDAIGLALAQRGWQRRPLVLVGFSGGGTLAALVAAALPRVCALVTVASPLDTDEWADARGYSRLAGSDNPAVRPALPARIAQLHLRGGEDRIVAADNGARYFAANPGAERRVVPGFGHGREWSGAWTALDREIVGADGCRSSG